MRPELGAVRPRIMRASVVLPLPLSPASARRTLHPYTKHLIQSLPRIDDRARRVSIPGQPPALDAPPSGCRFHPRCPHAMAVCRVEQPPMETVGPDHRVACFLVSGGGGDGG